MDELVEQPAAKAGNGDAVAEETFSIILGFLRSQGPTDEVQASIDQIPGAEAAIAASTSGTSFARLMDGGSLAPGTRLVGLGLGIAEIRIAEIQSIARQLFKFDHDKIGADEMGEIIAGTPGLGRFG